MRNDFKVMRDIGTHTRLTPMQRNLSLRKFVENLKGTPDAHQKLVDWGLELDDDSVQLEGRCLNPEKIIFKNSTVSGGESADWGRDLNREVISGVDLQCWMILIPSREVGKANNFVQTMKQIAPKMGIRVRDPQIISLRDDRTETYVRSIRENLNRDVQIVVTIFPTSRDDRYSAVKKLCCVEMPVPSQAINCKTISDQRKMRSVTQKIALQINCKLGGELWVVELPMKNIMIIGIDVYHDAARNGRSVGGFVASMNATVTRWYSRVCMQMPNQELIDALKPCMVAALKKYHEENHTLPDRIIVFRDGVGDGQLPTVAGYEAKQISDCFLHFGDYRPKLGVVVVQKRINTRLYAMEGRRLENPNPGTVMDHTITRKSCYDFYIVSQHVRQGTVSPTHYVVVHDDSGLKPDHMQRLAYKMTHMYYNWPGTVRVPAPCQYAHKLAQLIGQNIHKEHSLELSNRLFFL